MNNILTIYWHYKNGVALKDQNDGVGGVDADDDDDDDDEMGVGANFNFTSGDTQDVNTMGSTIGGVDSMTNGGDTATGFMLTGDNLVAQPRKVQTVS